MEFCHTELDVEIWNLDLPESHAEPTMPVATKTRGGPERGISAMIFKQCDIQQIENGVVFDEADEDMSCKEKAGDEESLRIRLQKPGRRRLRDLVEWWHVPKSCMT